MDRQSDFKTMMERYEQELMQLRRQATPVTTPSEAQAENPPAEEAAAEEFTTTLQVRVTAANEAVPIPNALVSVSRNTPEGPRLQQVLLTDISGLTEPITLPATDPSLTLQPEENIPLVTYEIQIAAPGYFRVLNSDVPLFSGVPTVQPVAMIPLPEFEEPNVTELQFRVPRNDL